MTDQLSTCARCPYKTADRICQTPDGKFPESCPTATKSELIDRSESEFQQTEIKEFARQASIQEAECYANRDKGYEFLKATKSRLEEIIEFASKMNYRRVGLAFCIGLKKEARLVEKLYSSKGFEVVSAVCKVGRIPKESIGLTKDQQIAPNITEAMCNPIMQAMVLNEQQTEFNVLLGLCVGHDSLFFKYADAPCTVLAVKDRLLGHNPLAAVYQLDSYYRALKS